MVRNGPGVLEDELRTFADKSGLLAGARKNFQRHRISAGPGRNNLCNSIREVIFNPLISANGIRQ